MRMKIAIIAAGCVGTALGKAWSRAGHTIVFGVRNPNSENARAAAGSAGPGARATSIAEASAEAEVVALATPWEATQSAVAKAEGLAGKIVIDCTNPLAYRNGELGMAIGFDTSGGEQVAGWAKGAHVFKALNQVGYLAMEDAKFPDGFPVMFVAGDDAERKPVVLKLMTDLGFEAVDAGPLKVARLLEPYAMLWIHLAYNQGFGRDFAFSLLRR
jgi:8-hydroxy-5-deazaflavin:NADPH oxidoreductase